MPRGLCFLIGVAVGATAMYFLDPQGGRRRRALMSDQAIGFGHDVERFAEQKVRDLADQARGIAAEARSMVGAR